MSADSVFQRVPPLSFEFELLSISRDEHSAEGFLCDVAYLLDAFHLFDFGMVADRYGEEQLVVLTSIHGAGGEVHVEFLCHDCRLVVDRDVLLVDAATAMTLLTDVHQLAAQSVAHVHHGCRPYACLAQLGYDVTSCLWLQLALQQIFLAREVGLEVTHACQLLVECSQLLSLAGSLGLCHFLRMSSTCP